MADQRRLAGDRGGGTVALAAVLNANIAVGGGRYGGETLPSLSDAELDGHGVVDGDLLHGFAAEGFGVAPGVVEALGGAGGLHGGAGRAGGAGADDGGG